MATSTTRVYSLDILKIIGTVLILFHHYQQCTTLYFLKGINFFDGRIIFGYVVELFFLLSGYFICSYEAKIKDGLSLLSFYGKRAVRLLPVSALSVLAFDLLQELYCLRFGAYYLDSKPTFFDSLITILGVQHGWCFFGSKVNYPLWYISVLMLCYVLFWIYIKISSNCHIPASVFYVVTIVLGIYGYLTKTNSPFLDMYSCRGYYSFFTGILLGSLLRGKNIGKKEVTVSLFMILAGLGIIAALTIQYPEKAFLPEVFLLYPGLVILLQAPFIQKMFRHSFWGEWAGACFDIYVWHIPVFLGLCLADNTFGLGIQFHKLSGMLIFTAVAHIWGLFSYFFIEKKITPFLLGLTNKTHSADK